MLFCSLFSRDKNLTGHDNSISYKRLNWLSNRIWTDNTQLPSTVTGKSLFLCSTSSSSLSCLTSTATTQWNNGLLPNPSRRSSREKKKKKKNFQRQLKDDPPRWVEHAKSRTFTNLANFIIIFDSPFSPIFKLSAFPRYSASPWKN